jgi:hypothetical protein
MSAPLAATRQTLAAAISGALAAAALAAIPARADIYTVLVDNSASTLLMDDPAFGVRLGSKISEHLEPRLKEGDTLELVLMGQATMREGGGAKMTAVISRRFRAREAAAWASEQIAKLPKSGLKAAEQTNIVGGIVAAARRIHADHPGEAFHLLMYTDGAECSGYIQDECKIFLEKALKGESRLPAPPADILAGADAYVVGIGQGVGSENVVIAENLRTIWEAWLKKAGAQEAVVLTQF